METTVNFNTTEYYIEQTEDITVEVFPTFVPERSSVEDKQFFYAYRVVITNNSEQTVKVIHRHWKIKDGNGKSYDVQGSGVVGEQPEILPGDFFEYTSFCPLHSAYGNMRGKYQLINENGDKFWVTVPLFFFRPPNEIKEEIFNQLH